ncbi:hypothetical protein QJQ45_009329 [Haematococcus lacustris]|nr:hypothetical protein QJQ45_009329 [Haematococcus lacustris]
MPWFEWVSLRADACTEGHHGGLPAFHGRAALLEHMKSVREICKQDPLYDDEMDKMQKTWQKHNPKLELPEKPVEPHMPDVLEEAPKLDVPRRGLTMTPSGEVDSARVAMETGGCPEDLQKTVEALQAQLAAKERELRESREREKRSAGPGSNGHSIVSDRGPNLNNNKFFVELAALLQVDLDLSSAYYPQTDGQTERMNRVIEEMLRHYIRPDQKDWAEHLPLVEFAINNAKQESTRCTPFYLNYGYHPRVAELLDLPQRVPQAHEFVANARQAVEQARQCLARAQKRMKAYQDTKRRDAVFEPGDMVLLSTQNMRGRVGQPGARKLKPRYVGPFRVEYMVGRAAVKLDLPEEWSRIHNVFHMSLVKPYRTYDASDRMPGHAGPPPLQWLDGEPDYQVEKVVDHRLAKSQGNRGGKPKKRQLKFLVKWQGHGDEHNTWESRSQLPGAARCQELLTAYLQKFGLEAGMAEAEAEG